jgi:hydrogenase maturation protein HypF
MGRLFDAVGALVLAKKDARFEAELAIRLERLAIRSKEKIPAYQFGIVQDKGGYILEPLLIFKGIVADLKNNRPEENIAYRFHLTVAEMTKKTLLRLKKDTGLNTVVLSGGVFQNRLLCRLLLGLLSREGFQVLQHRNIPCHDAGVSLGQVAIANHIS